MRSPREIALDIKSDYMDRGKSVPDFAEAYRGPAEFLDSWDSMYYADDADTVMIYLSSNLGGWRGDKAREIKAEIKSCLRERGFKV